VTWIASSYRAPYSTDQCYEDHCGAAAENPFAAAEWQDWRLEIIGSSGQTAQTITRSSFRA
jgi:hypothetical protein